MRKKNDSLICIRNLCVLFLLIVCVSIPSSIVGATTVSSSSNVASIKLDYYRKKLTKGTSYKIKIKGLQNTQSVSFSTQDKSVATVSTTGVVSARQIGSTKIVVTITENYTTVKTMYINIIVGKNAYSISLISKNLLILEPGQKTYLKTSIKPKDTAEVPSYRSQISSIASISSSGLIQANREGETVIYATLANRKYVKCLVRVVSPDDDTDSYEHDEEPYFSKPKKNR